jgi:membrane protease YdiL (CAAX protease family)
VFLVYYYGFISLVIEPLSSQIKTQFFSWAPVWFLERGTFLNGTPAVWMIVLSFVVRLLIDGLVNPFVEELYFRGYLLPKLGKLGILAPILNAALFGFAHFWQPFNFLTLFLINIPIQFLVWKRKSIMFPCWRAAGWTVSYWIRWLVSTTADTSIHWPTWLRAKRKSRW